jgi:hypothetical protein
MEGDVEVSQTGTGFFVKRDSAGYRLYSLARLQSTFNVALHFSDCEHSLRYKVAGV